MLTPRQLRSFVRDIDKRGGIDGCWIWRGATNGDSYGSVGSLGMAHRVAYELFIAPIPAGLEIDHLCRNPRCVNPHHLEAVTHGENLRRAKVYGPFQLLPYCKNGHPQTRENSRLWVLSKGERHPQCRLCNNARVRRSSHRLRTARVIESAQGRAS